MTSENEVEAQPEDNKAEQAGQDEDVVTPWTVNAGSSTGVDYDKLIEQFGCEPLSADLVEEFERVTGGRAHPLLRRGFFFAQRDLKFMLKRHEEKKPFFIYTGRGPSSGSLHLGHLIPFIFTKYLQDAFGVPVIIQMTDDEKRIWKRLSKKEVKEMCTQNIKDIISVGFDVKKTFIFTDFEYMCPEFYSNVVDISDCMTTNKLRKIFGFTDEDCGFKPMFPFIQAAPCFSSSFPGVLGTGAENIPCLIPAAIDQDPYFRMTRDVAPRIIWDEKRKRRSPKPAVIYSTFLPALQGANTKMSASDPNSCIYVDDPPNKIKEKISKYAFSGGKDTIDEHRKSGGNCDVDISFQFLRYFLEDDDELESIRQDYTAGTMLTGELKQKAISVLQKLTAGFQAQRKNVTDEVVAQFKAVRLLDYRT